MRPFRHFAPPATRPWVRAIRGFSLAVCLAGLIPVAAAAAERLPRPTDSYQADVAMAVGNTELTGTVRHDRGRELRTVNSKYGKQTILIRPDKGKAWLLQTALGVAVEVDLKSPEIGIDLDALYRLPATPVGRETVSGVPTTKYRVAGEVVKHSQFEGFVWSTDTGIMVRIEGTATDAGKVQPVHSLLSNLRRSPQDPSLFELPSGVSSLQLDAAAAKLLRGLSGH